MGKHSRTKRERREGSTLQQHQHRGKTLVPPLAALGLRLTRFSDRLLPELIWAGLLLTHGPRLNIIEMLRDLAAEIGPRSSKEGTYDLTLSGIAQMPEVGRTELLARIAGPPAAGETLSCLLHFADLPARAEWAQVLPPATDSSWSLLAETVRRTLGHQSEASTDIQWLYVFSAMAAGRLILPSTMMESAQEVSLYPHRGDLRKVRPWIRSAAKGLEGGPTPPESVWADAFWRTCLAKTPCHALEEQPVTRNPEVGTTRRQLELVSNAVRLHANASRETSAVDPRHDTTFGLALFSLALLEELMQLGNSSTLMARSALRTLLEANVTLSYLRVKDDPELWRSYRVFGSGQAKLVSLKFRDGLAPQPSSVDAALAEQLANEDSWEEFVSIELGHWNRSDLRTLAIQSGRKSEYDQFYGWTSMFAHAHWGAVRPAVFDTCANPLHRLHRIPRERARDLGDVMTDAVVLTDGLLKVVDELYPGLSERLALATPPRGAA